MRIFTFLLVLSILITGCDKTSTLKKLENISAELHIHNRNIAKVTGEAFDNGKISKEFHLAVITANLKFFRALQTADRVISEVKTIPDKEEAQSKFDYARRLMDVDVFPAFHGIVEAVASAINVPDDIKQKINVILTAIRLLFATITGLFSEHQIRSKQYDRNNVLGDHSIACVGNFRGCVLATG